MPVCRPDSPIRADPEVVRLAGVHQVHQYPGPVRRHCAKLERLTVVRVVAEMVDRAIQEHRRATHPEIMMEQITCHGANYESAGALGGGDRRPARRRSGRYWRPRSLAAYAARGLYGVTGAQHGAARA